MWAEGTNELAREKVFEFAAKTKVDGKYRAVERREGAKHELALNRRHLSQGRHGMLKKSERTKNYLSSSVFAFVFTLI